MRVDLFQVIEILKNKEKKKSCRSDWIKKGEKNQKNLHHSPSKQSRIKQKSYCPGVVMQRGVAQSIKALKGGVTGWVVEACSIRVEACRAVEQLIVALHSEKQGGGGGREGEE